MRYLASATREPRLREQNPAALLGDGLDQAGLDRRQQAAHHHASDRGQDRRLSPRVALDALLRDQATPMRGERVRAEQCAERERDRTLS